MRTTQEIIKRIRALIHQDSFVGYPCIQTLVMFLPFDQAEEFLTGVKKAEWTSMENTKDVILSEIKEYIPFVLGEAIKHRCLQSSTNVSILVQLSWMLGMDDVVAFGEKAENFAKCGAPVFKKICDCFDIQDEQLKDPRFTNMASGAPCSPGCKGCERTASSSAWFEYPYGWGDC
jgi:hypothetical protein